MQQIVNFAEAFHVIKGDYPSLADTTTLTQEQMFEIIDEAIKVATPEQIKLLDIRYK